MHPNGFSSWGTATVSALLQIFGILSWCVKEVRKSQNQDLRADPAWSINSGKMETRPGDFPGFRRLRATASSSWLKGQRHWFSPVLGTFDRTESSLLKSLVESRSLVLCACSSQVARRWSLPRRTGTRSVQTWQWACLCCSTPCG